MDIQTIENLRENNAAWSLLRKSSAPYILTFLFDVFKRQGNTEIPSNQLSSLLLAFQNQLREQNIEALKGSPDSILSSWASETDRILWRSHDPNTDTYVFTLRATTEESLQFVNGLEDEVTPVAAESKLKRIFNILEEVVLLGHGDSASHIKRLEERRDAIDREIERIEKNGHVEKSPYRIREEYRTLLKEIRSLTGDFRKVEESFRSIARDVQVTTTAKGTSRGDILEYILESSDEIRSSDQGKSFFGFLALLNSPKAMDHLDELRQHLANIPELENLDLDEIMKFERRLLDESGRVNKTVQRLSRQLRKLLDDKANAERQRLLEQIQNIISAFSRKNYNPEDANSFVTIEELESFRMISDYNPYRPPAKLKQNASNIFRQSEGALSRAFEEFTSMERFDLEVIKSNIIQCLANSNKEWISLNDIFQIFPLKQGLVEIFGYLQIAHDAGIDIKEKYQENLKIVDTSGNEIMVTLPRITFTRELFSSIKE